MPHRTALFWLLLAFDLEADLRHAWHHRRRRRQPAPAPVLAPRHA